MKYRRFEDLPVWKDAIELAVRVFALTSRPNFKGYGGIRDQIERAVVSISNNIAEGFERGTTPELLTFLYISRGSSGETRSLLCLIDRMPGFEDLRSEIKSKRFATTSRLGRLDAKLRHKGPAVFDIKERRATKEARERVEFLKELEKMKRRS
jgi:four helix bundle protein